MRKCGAAPNVDDNVPLDTANVQSLLDKYPARGDCRHLFPGTGDAQIDGLH